MGLRASSLLPRTEPSFVPIFLAFATHRKKHFCWLPCKTEMDPMGLATLNSLLHSRQTYKASMGQSEHPEPYCSKL